MCYQKTFVILLCSILLVACGSLKPEPTVTPTSTVTSTSSPTVTPTLTPTNTATAEPSKTPGPTITLIPPSSTPNALGLVLPTGKPLAEWNGISIMPDSIAGDESTEGSKGTYVFTVKGDVSKVKNYYKKELSKKGWTLLVSGNNPKGNVMDIYTKGSDGFSVVVVVADEKEKLLLVLLVVS